MNVVVYKFFCCRVVSFDECLVLRIMMTLKLSVEGERSGIVVDASYLCIGRQCYDMLQGSTFNKNRPIWYGLLHVVAGGGW